jgi:hypothetical protein
MSAQMMDGPVLTGWAAVKIDENIHLIGFLLGGHPRLMAGRWIVTSPLVAYSRSTQTAITASAGTTYHLLERLQLPPPEEVARFISRITGTSRLPTDTIDLVEL